MPLSALAQLLLQLGILLSLPYLLGLLLRRFGQPRLLAQILAGVALGPSILGAAWPAAHHALFPEASWANLKLVGDLGLTLFVFLMALELDPTLFKRKLRRAWSISLTGLALSALLFGGLSVWLHREYSPPDAPLWPLLTFLIAALAGTAFPILTRMLSERHLLRSSVGKMAIAVAAADELSLWALLTIALALSSDLTPLWTTASLGLIGLYIAALLHWLRPTFILLAGRVSSREGFTQPQQVAVLLLLCLSALFTERLGTHPLVGAFLFGAIIPRQNLLAQLLTERLETVTRWVLLPLFFATLGLQVRLDLLQWPRDGLVLTALLLLATAARLGGIAPVARLAGFSWREASALGVLLNSRGPLLLIVLSLGLERGVIPAPLFTILVLAGVILTALTGPVLRMLYPDAELLRHQVSHLAPQRTARQPNTVLMCVADARVGPAMAHFSAALAEGSAHNHHLLALHLWAPSHSVHLNLRKEGMPPIEKTPLVALVAEATALKLEVHPFGFLSSAPAQDISQTAEACDADLILLGSHKSLSGRSLFSGVVGEILERARQPVAVLMNQNLERVQRVLVAYLGGPSDRVALRIGQQLAQGGGPQVHFVRVAPEGEGPWPAPIEEGLPRAFMLRNAGRVSQQSVSHREPAEAILPLLAQGYDLLVIGMETHWGFSRSRGTGRAGRLTQAVSTLVVHCPAELSAQVRQRWLAGVEPSSPPPAAPPVEEGAQSVEEGAQSAQEAGQL